MQMFIDDCMEPLRADASSNPRHYTDAGIIPSGAAVMSIKSGRNPMSRHEPAPFYFNSSTHLLRIQKEHASNLGEFLGALRTCTELSVFQHTFRTLQEHHFIRQGFSNDFAHWAYTDCNEAGLAEQLASVDVRTFTSLAALRERIVKVVEDYLKANL